MKTPKSALILKLTLFIVYGAFLIVAAINSSAAPPVTPKKAALQIPPVLEKSQEFQISFYNSSVPSVVVVTAEIGLFSFEKYSLKAEGLDAAFQFPVLKELRREKDRITGIEKVQAYSRGSGFFISSDGEILTNYHVIQGATSVTVTLNTGEVLKADIAWFDPDPKTDLALLKAQTETKRVFRPVVFGNSDNARVGQFIYIIGHPFGLFWSYATGSISGLKRQTTTHKEPMLQMQSVIKPGNSGSPVFNINGEVIGMIQSVSDDIGFAIPANFIKAQLQNVERGQK